MRINMKRFTIGAILLAILSLLLQGCGQHNESSIKFMDQKPISGTVSDTTKNLPLPDATVVAYPIVNGVPDLTSPLSAPVTTDSNGFYKLYIPASYTGSVLLIATPASTSANRTPIRTVIPATVVQQAQIPPAMINFATETAVLYIENNLANSFTSDNIRMTLIQLEALFGVNFTQTPLPSSATDTSTTKQQQDLLVSITAIQQLIAHNPPMTQKSFVISLAAPSGLGTTVAAQLNAEIAAAASTLIMAGTLPSTYVINTTITAAITALGSAPLSTVSPVSPGLLSDTTPPTAPSGLSATSVRYPVLTWTASTDDSSGVAGYLVYRAVGSGSFTQLGTVTGAVTFTDIMTSQATAYSYKVVAYDAARNRSIDSNTVTVTTPTFIPGDIPTYTLSGRVTYNGAGVQGVVMTIIGTGFGSAITAADGTYSFTKVINGGYSISAALPGFVFSPGNRSFSVHDADISGLDFVSDKPGTVTGETHYPDGTVVITTTYPDGTITITTTYPNGTVTITTTYPNGSVSTSTTYPNGSVATTVSYPDGTVAITTTYPNGSVSTSITYPDGTVAGSTTYPGSTVVVTINY